MKRFFTLIMLSILACGYAMAYDFSAECSTGQTLYYNITSAVEPYTVEVTSETGIGYSSKPTGNLEIPETVEYNSITYSVTGIGYDAFYGCNGLSEITIPNSVTSIGDVAFSGCSGLTSVTIPNSVTSIGAYAFRGCSGLTSVTIPNSVTSIDVGAFSGTGWFNNQPDGILYIDNWCLGYKGDTPTEELTINEGTIGIANHAFTGAIVVTIPNSVTHIGNAFNSHVQINLNPDNTNFRIVDNVLYDYGMTRLIIFMGSQDSYTIPNSIAIIEEEAFYNCSGLTSVTIPNSVTSIGGSAFSGCSGLTEITIPESVTSIGDSAFMDCENISVINILANTPPELDNGFSSTTYSTATLKVPCNTKDAYENANEWSNFQNIKQICEIQGTSNGHGYVDLGLPSGNKWATCNVGASIPEGFGNYYGWGETYNKEIGDWNTYIYYNGGFTKYTSSDGLTTLEAMDDAATVNWGDGWRMPTKDEVSELLNNCSSIWTTRNGVNGRLFTSNINGNTIFLPAAGKVNEGGYEFDGQSGTYWSSTVRTSPTDGAWDYGVYQDVCELGTLGYRKYGRSVRAVYTLAPTVVTNSATNLTFSSATLNASITDNGNSGIIERGFKYGTDRDNLSETVQSDDATSDFSVTLTGLVPNTTYYFVAYATNGDAPDYAGIKSFKTPSEPHDFVDLGLPSGTMWATMNIGADQPSDYGNYYSWGEVTHPDSYESYDWSEYDLCNGSSTTINKYCTNGDYGTVDNLTTLSSSNDAATANWGNSWRMPTSVEYQELIDNCTWEWSVQDGKEGYLVSGNGNSIFLPAAGYMDVSGEHSIGTDGNYWTSSLREDVPTYAMSMLFYSGTMELFSQHERPEGLPIRPVYAPSNTASISPATIPYSCDFEDADENANWTLSNGSYTNGWYIGTATNNGGENGLYVSNDGGASNVYDNTFTRSIYAYRTFEITENSYYSISFDWKSYGQTRTDYLRAFLIPTSLNADLSAGNTNGITDTPDGSIDIYSEGGKMVLAESWQRNYKQLSLDAGTYNIVFYWRNSNSTSMQPPAAIDNIVIRQSQEPVVVTSNPTDLVATSVTLHGNIVFNGESEIVEYGFLFGTDHENLDQTLQSNGSTDDFSYSVTGLTSGMVYYYRAYASNSNGISYGEIKSFATSSQPTNYFNEHGYVDLGLPSGKKWATINVGAITLEQFGNYYAWGEIETKENYIWENYIYAEGTTVVNPQLTKYCNNSSLGKNGFTDTLTTLEATDDAATVNWGEGWGMPTREDFQELVSNCDTISTTLGMLFTGTNGNSIFFPASGYYNIDGFSNVSSYEDMYWVKGNYWSSSLRTDAAGYAYFLDFTNAGYCNIGGVDRYWGLPIRPVYTPSNTANNNVVYSCDFEDADENANWTLANGSQTNKWHIGTAANNGGENGLYISNDDGTSNAYGNTATSYVYAYRNLEIAEDGYYTVSFDWLAQGEVNYDLLRAFITPTSAALEAGNANGMTSSNNTTPSGWTDVANPQGQLSRATEWQQSSKETYLDAGTYNLVFFWKNDGAGGSQPPAAIDNVSITKISCPSVASITVSEITTESASISWTERGSAGSWEIIVSNTALDETQLESYADVETATSTTYSATGLSLATNYIVYVRAACSADEKSLWTSTTFTTGQNPVSTPYTCDFEDADENRNWAFVNGDLTNNWYIGAAASNGGSNGLYVTNDSGTSNAYNNNETSYIYTYRTIEFTESATYSIIFNWKAKGEYNYDLLRAFITPTSAVLEAGNANGMTSASNTTPNGWTDVANPEEKLNNTSDWQQSTKETYLDAGTYNLVFFWKNDNSGGYQPPAAIDNISIKKVTCLSVTNIRTSSITTSSAYINWHESANASSWEVIVSDTELDATALENYTDATVVYDSSYNATGLNVGTKYYTYIRAVCSDSDKSLWQNKPFRTKCNAITVSAENPYSEDFNSYNSVNYSGTTPPVGYPYHTMPDCWDFANMSETSSTYPHIFLTSTTTYAVSGYCLYFRSSNTTPAYAVLPPFSNSIENLSLEFIYKNQGATTANGTLHVGISNDISDLDASYVDIKSFEQTTTKTTAVVNFATETALTGEYYIVFKYVGGTSSNYGLSIDNVSVRFLSSDAEITAFTFAEDAEIANINSDAATITSVVSYSTANLNGLVPTITVSDGATISPESGVAQDFTSPVTYTVTAENGTTKEWTVSVSKAATASSAKDILSFTFDGQQGEAVIDADSHTITAYAEWDYDMSNIIPTITVSPMATISPASGVAQDFTNPVSYTVTAEDVSSQTWTVTVLPDPNACPNPEQITVGNIAEQTATISWQQRYLETSYNVKVSSTEMSEMTATADIYDNVISSTTLDLTGLTLERTYYVYVQSACGNAEGWVSATFRTIVTPATIPYICDFEEVTENANWTLANGDHTNKWYIGTAANNGGENGLYISNDDGVSNAYGNTATSYVYAYRNLNVAEDGYYMVSFDWMAQGESNYDLLRAFIVPTSVPFEVGNANGMTSSNNTTPDGWTDIANPEGKLNLKSDWQQSEKDLYLEAGAYSLVFFWKNDDTQGNQPPAAIDNISVTKILCPSVASITVTEITSESATISWTEQGAAESWDVIVSERELSNEELYSYAGTETVNSQQYVATGLNSFTTYNVYVRSNCGADGQSNWTNSTFTTACGAVDIPYSETFEDYTGSYIIPDCWERVVSYTSGTYVYPYISSSNAHNGSKCLYMYIPSASTANENIIALPSVNDINTLQVSLWAKYGNNVPQAFEIGYMRNDEFTAVKSITLTTTYQQYTAYMNMVPADADKIAIRAYHTSSYVYVYVDDITVSEMPTCLAPEDIVFSDITTNSASVSWTDVLPAAAWQYRIDDGEIIDVDAKPISITALAANTEYKISVRTVCDDDEYTEWTEKTFITNCDAVAEFPWMENFNSLEAGIPSCWDNSEGTSNDSYKWRYYETGYEGVGLRFDSYLNSTGKTNMLKTPVFDLSSITRAKLEFWYKNPAGGNLAVFVSADGGATYTDNVLATGLTGVSDWTKGSYDISSYCGNSNVVIVFEGTSNYGNGDAYIYLDEIGIREISSAAEITSFSFAEESELAVIDSGAATITSVVSYTTASLDGLVPTITISELATITPESGVAQDFTSPVTYTVMAENGTTKEWTVSVSKAATASSANNILSFTFDGQVGETVIDADSHTVTAYAEWDYDISNIIPAITVSPQATINPASGVAQDFTNSISYTVTAEDESSQMWTVTIINDPNACPNPEQITVSNIGEETATISWQQRYLEISYNVKVSSTEMSDMTATADIYDNVISSTTLDLTGLIRQRTYYVYVQSVCGNAEGWVSTTFTTIITPATIPYTCDFEDITENDNWTLANGTQVNKWHIGTAVNNGGETGLYISNDEGTSNEYNVASTSYVYAYRNLNIAEDSYYMVSFDWKAQGEGNYDLLRAFLAPTSAALEAGSANGMTSSNNTTPDGWTDIANPEGKLNLKSTWQQSTKDAYLEAGTYNLVFFWKNDVSQGTQPPAAIDNIEVTRLFPVVETSTATDITNTSATLKGRILYSDYSEVTTRGFLFGTSSTNLNQNYTSDSDSTVFSYPLTGLNANTQYYCQAYATVDGEIKYGEIKTFNIANGQQGGYYYVDLGLPSGTMWATCNVGATSPQDFGNYYAWAETEPKETYNWSTYSYCNGSVSTLTKYCSYERIGNNGFTDGLTTLEASDDAATVNWGEDWRMPTFLDIDELVLKCTFETIEQNGVLGSLITGPNGNSIFLPAAGSYQESSLVLNDHGYYWASTSSINSVGAYNYIFDEDDYSCGSYSRYYGFPVRPIYRTAPTTSVSGTQSYYCDFEDENENFKWMVDTSITSLENKWYIGTAANNGGNRGLYISDDNGASNAYDGSSRTYIYTYRSFGITENDFYEASFDWRAMGGGNEHLLRAFIIPMSQNPFIKYSIQDNGNFMLNENNDAPDGWIDGGLGILNMKSEWQHASMEVSLEAGAYYLVFFWKNNSSSSSLYSQPPAAIDNISIHKSACPHVVDITVSVTDQSAEIGWTEQGSAENWEIVVSETPLDNDALDSSENIVPLTTASYSATGLSSLTQYYVYVRSACSTDDKSRWESTTFLTGGIAVTTLYPDTRTNTTAMLRAKAFSIEDINYTFYYGTSRNSLSAISDAAPTVTDSIATIQLRNLIAETQYYYTAEATNSYGTVRGDTLSFITCGSFTDERDGNQYYTIQIGDQTWMAQNLRFAGDIQLGTASEDTSSFVGYRYYPENAENVPTYGYLYNWTAAMNGESGDETNPSRIQGICPNGWHLPSRPEFLELEEALTGNTDAYSLDAGAMLSGQADLWGNNALTQSEKFGKTGFNALPVGQNIDGIYSNFYGDLELWTTKDFIRSSRCAITVLISGDEGMRSDASGREIHRGLSVRCVKGLLTYAYDTVKYCGESYAYHDTTITASGDYIRHIHTANDMDTTYHLHLTLYPTLTATISYSNGCHGANNGFVEVAATGGSNSYTYLWNTTDQQTAARLENLEAGEYVVNVTDAVGCSVTASQTLTEPDELTASLAAGEIACNGGTTSISSTVEGGTSPYTYIWSNGSSEQEVSNVTAGTYSVTVRDLNSCSATTSVSIAQPTALTTSLSATAIACNGGTSDITNTVGGGTEPYTYTWTPSASSQNLTGVVAGTYSVTVTDSHECSATSSVEITQPEALTSVLSAGSVACNGGTASITNTVSGGTTPYTFAWDNGSNTQDLSGVTAGTYAVTVSDNRGCSVTATAEITQPEIFVLTLEAGTIACHGETTTISSNVEGGTAPYQYAWSTGATTNNLTNAVAGTYSVTITDANTCSTNAVTTITQPEELSVTISGSTSVCEGTSTRLAANVSGGTGGYTYAWSSGETSEEIPTTNITAATSYSVTVSDANSCSATASVSVVVGTTPGVEIVANPSACFGNNIVLQANVSNAGTNYTLTWSATPADDAGLTTTEGDRITVTPTAEGNYTYTASLTTTSCSDDEPFNSSAEAAITVNPLPDVAITNNTGTSELTCNTETISLTATGGTTYAWSSGATTEQISLTTSGLYSVTVTDANTCSNTASTVITQNVTPPAVSISNTSVTSILTCSLTSINVEASGDGESYQWSGGASPNTAENTLSAAGTYTVTASAANGCTSTASILISEDVTPPTLSITNSTGTTELTCERTSINVGVTSDGVSYQWSDGASPNTASNTLSAAGTYTVTATGENGCTSTADITITQNVDLPNVVATASDSSICLGSSTTLTATGAESYQWSPITNLSISIGNEVVATPTETTTYTVTATAENGCTLTADVPIVVNTAVENEIALTVCESYDWDGTTYTETGDFTQTFTAANGCDSVVTLHLTISSTITTEISDTACDSYQWNDSTYYASGEYIQTFYTREGCDSIVTLNLTINAPTVSNDTIVACNSYEWHGQTYLESGDYEMTLPNANVNGCDSIMRLHLTINQSLTESVEVTTCDSYQWNDSTYYASGDYEQTFIAVNGCDSVVTLHLTINSSTTSEVSAQMCSGVPYTYEGQTFTEAGTYEVPLVNANGCDSIVTLTITYANNCSGIVSGIITDENTDEPISNARVTVGNKVTRTNAEGEYSLEVLRGRKALRVSAAGFSSYSRTVDIQSDTVFNASLKSPRIETDVDSLTVSSYPYLEHNDTITLSNTGSGTLIWSSITEYDNLALIEDSVIQQRSNTRSLWDSIQTFATRENAEQAIATDGFFIYTSSWMRPGEFNRYTPNGEYVETFYIENVGSIRNLSYDGTNFYGTEGTNIIFKLDLDNQTLVDSIETDIQEIRHCSFNKQDGSLLAGSWNSLYRIDIENGTSEQIRNDLANVYSSAFDNLSPGGPYLWLFSQTSQNNGPSAYIRQFNINTGEYTDRTHYLDDINLSSTSLAGGICASEYVCEGKFVLLADVQNPSGSNTIATYEIGCTNSVVRTGKKSGTIEPNESESIYVRARATETGDYSATIKYRAAVMGQQSRDVNLNISAVAPECDAVQQISIVTDTFHTVTLDWQPVELGNYESVSYLVFNTASQFAIDTVSGTTVTYAGLPAGSHCFSVMALSQADYTCLSAASDTVCAEIEPIPCNVPLALEAANDGESIFLTWNKPVGVEYFRILRDDNAVEEVLYDVNFIDANVVPDVTYCYTIFAYFVDDICNEIVGTACSKIVSGECAESPVLQIEAVGYSVHLNWTVTSDSYTYKIFRNGVAIGMTTDTTYFDNVNPGYNYCYKVESLCEYGMFINSNEECVFVNEEGDDVIGECTEDGMSVYPNPTYGQFFIEGQRIAVVQIFNAAGMLVSEIENTESERITINCNDWNPGLYNIRIISAEGETTTRKVTIFR